MRDTEKEIKTTHKIAKILVNYPVKNNGLFYYYQDTLHVGDLVEVPLGRRKEWGCVISLVDESFPEFKNLSSKVSFKYIISKKDDWTLSEKELHLYNWMSRYYHYPMGQLIFDCFPQFVKKPRELKVVNGEKHALPFPLNDSQKAISQKLKTQLQGFSRSLIHGVTGSGKTVVYLEIIKEVLTKKKSVLFLLPEINLTPQFTQTFSEFLDCSIYTYHSELSASQKYQLWKMSSTLDKPILVLGVRSAIFLPIVNLGLIIIDEEHDQSFKQEDRCPYNARDVASKKAQILDIPLILGSATPSLETFYSFHKKSGAYHEMRQRAADAFLPEIVLIDSRQKNEKKESDHRNLIWPLEPKTIEAIQASLDKKEQVLVFVNRLGFSQYLQCRSCGHQFECPNCSVMLRYYRKKNQLSCHHCEYKSHLPDKCNQCGCMTLIQKGFGTEKIQDVLKHSFPNHVIDRFDRDEITNFKKLQKKLNEFHQGQIDILVGTQMLSKGHNFEKVKLVVILGIDGQLNYADFRASERVYQTLTQVSGRAGRYSDDGKVLIQTMNPDHSVFRMIKEKSFNDFYFKEFDIRNLCKTPPFWKIISLNISSRFQEKLIHHVHQDILTILQGLQSKHFKNTEIMGPKPAFIEKRSNQFTWVFLIKAQDTNTLHQLVSSFELNYQPVSGMNLKIDVDPYTML